MKNLFIVCLISIFSYPLLAENNSIIEKNPTLIINQIENTTALLVKLASNNKIEIASITELENPSRIVFYLENFSTSQDLKEDLYLNDIKKIRLNNSTNKSRLTIELTRGSTIEYDTYFKQDGLNIILGKNISSISKEYLMINAVKDLPMNQEVIVEDIETLAADDKEDDYEISIEKVQEISIAMEEDLAQEKETDTISNTPTKTAIESEPEAINISNQAVDLISESETILEATEEDVIIEKEIPLETIADFGKLQDVKKEIEAEVAPQLLKIDFKRNELQEYYIELVFNSRPNFELSKNYKNQFLITINNFSLNQKSLTLPYYAPKNFNGFSYLKAAGFKDKVLIDLVFEENYKPQANINEYAIHITAIKNDHGNTQKELQANDKEL